MATNRRLLMIDNFDSFTYNIVEEFAKRGCLINTYRNSIPLSTLRDVVIQKQPHLILLSPGPGHPTQSGICVPLIQEYAGQIPIVGICLGHQAIIIALGGEVRPAPEVVHGKSSFIYHNSQGIFHNLPNPLTAARYHSLCATRVPEMLEVSARTKEGLVMAVRQRGASVPLIGLQFHPESIMSTYGGALVANIIKNIETRDDG